MFEAGQRVHPKVWGNYEVTVKERMDYPSGVFYRVLLPEWDRPGGYAEVMVRPARFTTEYITIEDVLEGKYHTCPGCDAEVPAGTSCKVCGVYVHYEADDNFEFETKEHKAGDVVNYWHKLIVSGTVVAVRNHAVKVRVDNADPEEMWFTEDSFEEDLGEQE